ncbi:efflux RND transporter periplasmic adaptor subunit [Limosilactobacillus vaginalis]|uniref:efflux RND transporter periplasmic adaptor subunit n=1 Tax=Limosilactobacillus vaginalis TaxID=1633 RepID=UPI0025A3E332|nr:biotin/lipoyl-binding protein [Limosilactobacillus vaginalis]MDM8260039.1 biotin/lipoyl-binding protein [Limosilactobacillus vaginalis]
MTAKRTSQKQSRWRKLLATKRRRLIMIISILVILILIIIGIQHSNTKKDKSQSTFSTMRVTSQPSFNLTGKIEPVETQMLTVPSGKLKSLNVKNGDHVVQGQAILTMHNDDLQSQVANLQNQLDQSQSASSDDQTTGSSMQQQLKNISEKVNQTLVAPYSGYVSIDQSKEDAPVVTLYSDNLQFVGQVSEYDYDKLHQSTDLKVKALATNHVANTQVNYLATIPTKGTGNNTRYKVTASVNANQFMAGQTAKASIKQDGILIPKKAVRNGKVFIVDTDGKARKAKISGHAVNSSYVVTDGIDEGDKIVINPNSKLKNNTKVD